MNEPVLLLNQNYEPLNICRARRAVVLLSKGKAESVADHAHRIRTVRRAFPRPAVIRMLYHVRRPRLQVRLSRREVFVRDEFTCQYCGTSDGDLTVDHVVPRRLGGKRRWENLVTACRRCNLHKAGRTPREAKMRLRARPDRPPSAFYHVIWQMAAGNVDEAWQPYLAHHLNGTGRNGQTRAALPASVRSAAGRR